MHSTLVADGHLACIGKSQINQLYCTISILFQDLQAPVRAARLVRRRGGFRANTKW